MLRTRVARGPHESYYSPEEELKRPLVMEPFPAPIDRPTHSKNLSGTQVRVDEVPSPKQTRGGTEPKINLRRANTVAQGSAIKRNLELKANRERTATTGIAPGVGGLRAKDSHELLRKNPPLQRSQTHRGPLEARPVARKAGHFTVGSVGQNGKIFLRPIANSSQKNPSIVPFSSIDQVTTDRLQPQRTAHPRDDPSRWSSSQLSELRPREPPREEYAPVISDSPRPESANRHRQRANSFSTISEKQSVSGAGKRGELRIVIDRTEDRPKTANEKSPDTALEIPIPHYRLGSPRFNTEGSARLQSSVYTRTSMSDNFRNSTLLGGLIDPMSVRPTPYNRDSFARHRASFAVSMFSGAAAIDLSRASPAPRNSMVYDLKGPVEPSIYETLVSDMDGETVVRYIPGTKDISAATPARIVAQISSESFMDYELVSDFFLTFRSYLSANHLLALLLARLQWAINRLQEDGRIIRIRTFAALRHWILNYFVDDFITNYDLRAHFCETINNLYQEVKSRRNGGTSDLKILIDLKRCWNGKCSVYWTASDFSRGYNDPDSPILPGNVQLELPNDEIPQQPVPVPGVVPHIKTSRKSFPVSIQHDRNDSAGTVNSIPYSAKSEQSILALSCSLPPKSPRRFSTSYSRSKAPRPVVLGLTKSTSSHEPPPTSPMVSRHPLHGHKRSGSFSDSFRDDRLPMSGVDAGSPATPKEILDPVSFIRGALYPPPESYMTLMAPDSPPLAPPSSSTNSDRRSTPGGGPKPAQLNSGMKTIIGSIRRALHTRNGGHSVSARIANASDTKYSPSRGKTSAMPNHIALGSDFYRERRIGAIPKRPTRYDVLCEQSLRQYKEAMENAAQKENQPQGNVLNPQSNEQDPSLIPHDAFLQSPRPEESKIKSGLTMGSGSIVIVDDTGFEFPSMSGAVHPDTNYDMSQARLNAGDAVGVSSKSFMSTSTYGYSEHTVPICFNGEVPELPQNLYAPSISSQRRSYSNEPHSTPRKRVSLSLRLRKYASFQSGISRQRASVGSDGGKSAVSSKYAQDLADKPMGPSLRRRPGGNLRQMQFVDDVNPTSGRESPASIQSYNDSLAESTSTTSEVATRPPSALIPPNPRQSLIQARSGRNMKRSFEAAIARFAEIPDDEDGGVESTLLKLEGKWPSSPPADQEIEFERVRHFQSDNHWHQKSNADLDVISRRRQTDKSAYSTVGGHLAPPRPYSDSVAESEDSYNSIPLLERGLTDESMKRPPPNLTQPTNQIIDVQGAPLSQISSRDTSEMVSSHPSIQIIQETDSMRRIPRGSTLPEPAALDAGQVTPKHLSAMSVDLIDAREAMDARISAGTHSLGSSTVDIPPHPLAHPPSPPMTIQHPSSFASCVSPLEKVLFQAQPLTPDTSPMRQVTQPTNQSPRNVPPFSGDVLSNSEKDQQNVITDEPDHVPFVLACESHMLAQQLTLVEMAALSEVDWRDLVEMRWSSSAQCLASWVQFLTSEERKGIDLVVGRFNLMVKWVVSEIVLTRNIQERARTIIKFIHTAAHARRICNYATMLQIAIALASSDCSRLQNTWQLVPSEDRRLFKDMECLIQPVRNFHDLRVEMETANLQEGCIPFIGLYVHDLTYNAQKPAQISRNEDDLLVNFERYRTAARIVKSLLRLIDASTKYRFEPVHGVIERCLWIACLSEGEIQARSKDLE
ncbi:Guanine-nucleotide dissociation stimulator CDC25 [Penicillium malachiteum]|uniref:Guanine-nucleotide dissociation stimulator CDC25 n=1 Tax=Penicillium malachiteum TaxID=1324776 RepID=A0AAD6HML1_9EURO|nr:Guanine-nucleotide dissociation stimulator CDC25 [Penicillium malachiteum]